jgi:hypothetical protein
VRSSREHGKVAVQASAKQHDAAVRWWRAFAPLLRDIIKEPAAGSPKLSSRAAIRYHGRHFACRTYLLACTTFLLCIANIALSSVHDRPLEPLSLLFCVGDRRHCTRARCAETTPPHTWTGLDSRATITCFLQQAIPTKHVRALQGRRLALR